MAKRQATRKQWLKLIDQFMGLNKHQSLDWETVLDLEGGYGQNKIKSVEDAVDPVNAGTWPHMWFSSGQTDYSVYKRYDYIYSLLFGRQISAGTISMFAEHLEARVKAEKIEHKITVVDWGGSIFTSVDILDLSKAVEAVVMVNLPSPQMDFAEWFLSDVDMLAHPILLHNEDDDHEQLQEKIHGEGPVTFLFSEVLEHEKEPLQYLDQIDETFHMGDLYVASSFCTPAYGHHIPIFMDGEACRTVRVANSRWRKGMEKRGYELAKIEGWNSRLWWAWRLL